MTVLLIAQPVLDLVLGLVPLAGEAPEDEDVKAGWLAFVVFLLLIGAVVLLGFSLVKHLRRAQAAEEAGLYGSDETAKDARDVARDLEDDQEPRQT